MVSETPRTIPTGERPGGIRSVVGDKMLYAVGNVDLIYQPCIGLCGSRNASDTALTWSREFGREAARQGVVVVSGYARGVDAQAHIGALEANGATIAVLPEGIQHFRTRKELRALIDLERNFLAISMFEPDAPWTVWRAMERNKLIIGLSSGIFVIEARETGGTINAAYETIRQGKQLWAVSYDSHAPGREGNRKLLRASDALPVKHVADFRQALEDAMAQPVPDVRQLVMSVFRPEREG